MNWKTYIYIYILKSPWHGGVEYACIKHRNSELYEPHVSSWLPGTTENCHHPQKDRMVLVMISTASRISSSLITSGGANLMMSPWVGLARSPLSRSRRHTFQASQSKEKPSSVCWSMIRSLQGWGRPGKNKIPSRSSVCLKFGRPRFHLWVGKIPWRRKWQPTPVLLPGKSHGWGSLAGYSPRGGTELASTERHHCHCHSRKAALSCKLASGSHS